MNETMKAIIDRRSHKSYKSDPISDEILEEILTAGKYAPNGMNKQAWHFTVVKSEAGKAMFKAAVKEMMEKRNPLAGKDMVAAARHHKEEGLTVLPEEDMRGAPVLIVVSGSDPSEITLKSCVLAMGNMFIAASSFGIMSGWSKMITKDLFGDPKVKAQFKIPEGNEVIAAAFFGYPLATAKDRGPRKEGIVTEL